MTVSGVHSLSSLYSSIYQSNMSLYTSKISDKLSLKNNASSSGGLSASVLQYVNDIKSASKGISGALSSLTGGEAFNKKTMVSSDTDVMSVKYTGNKYSSPQSVSVKVDQLASGQVNEGSKLSASAKYGSTIKNTFAIEINGKTTNFSVTAASGDTNKDVQQKMADEINKAGIGVKASVVVDKETNTSSLKIDVAGTGDDAKNKFTVKDITGSAVANTGANTVTQKAQNAVYSVNGGEARTSKSNTVSLGNDISVTFKKTSDEAVRISRGTDKEYAKTKVKDLVSGFNKLYSAAEHNAGSDSKAANLLLKLQSITKTYSKSLSEAGINVSKDGTLSIDSDKLDKAAANGKLEKLFTENRGNNFGFTNQLSKLAGSVSNNTTNYVSKSSVSGYLTNYSSVGSLLQDNSQNSGWLLDYLL